MDFLGSYLTDDAGGATPRNGKKPEVGHFSTPGGSNQPNSFREENGTGSPQRAMQGLFLDLNENKGTDDIDACPIPTVPSDLLTPMTGHRSMWTKAGPHDSPISKLESMRTVFLTPRNAAKRDTTFNNSSNVAGDGIDTPTLNKGDADSGPLQGLMGFFKPSN